MRNLERLTNCAYLTLIKLIAKLMHTRWSCKICYINFVNSLKSVNSGIKIYLIVLRASGLKATSAEAWERFMHYIYTLKLWPANVKKHLDLQLK